MRHAHWNHAVWLLVAASSASAQSTIAVSVTPTGALGNQASNWGALSADGRFVAIASRASNLVTGDVNNSSDLFVRDLGNSTTELVSRATSGVPGNQDSFFPSISSNGRFVAFYSTASNLVPGDTNGAADIFVRDRLLQTTERVSVSSSGAQADVPFGIPSVPSISGDGRFVVFESDSNSLVPGDTNNCADVFLRDRAAGTTVRVSVFPNGAELPAPSEEALISGDGRFVAYGTLTETLAPSDGNGLADTFLYEIATGQVRCVTCDASGQTFISSGVPTSISFDGRLVGFQSTSSNIVPNDTNGKQDCFVRDMLAGTFERVNVGAGGAQGLLYDSHGPTMSSDGRYVLFFSSASFVPNDLNTRQDVFRRDRLLGVTEMVSVKDNGDQLNQFSFACGLSGAGNVAVWGSYASDVVPGDTNNNGDVFARILPRAATTYCTAGTTTNGCNAIMSSNTGVADMSNGAGSFVLTCAHVEGAKTGLIFYGASGRASTPWSATSTSTLCVDPPLQRAPAQNSGGNFAQCDGTLTLDLFQFFGTHPGALGQPIYPGQVLDAQAWFRDPSAPKTTNLSNAMEFTIAP
jgi:Tol biopolymer transport system component